MTPERRCGAFSKKVTGKPIKFVGMGEKFDALEPFHPERMASRILGMGDMLSLIEKAQEDYDEKKAAELEKKIRKNKFTLEDFLEQMGQIKKMGGIAKILDMMPGINSNAKNNINMAKSEQEFMQMEAIIQSMTKAERGGSFDTQCQPQRKSQRDQDSLFPR